MLSYTVKRGFHHEGVYYTRENAQDLKEFPRAVRDGFIADGLIEEHDDRVAPDAAPASPAKTTKAEK